MGRATRPGKALAWLTRALSRGTQSTPQPPARGDTAPDESRLTMQAFVTSLIHELRTPLAALSGEVEIALRHDRSPAVYRDTLARIAEQVIELEDITGDLALLADPDGFRALSESTVDLSALTSQLSLHYKSDQLIVPIAASSIYVSGHELLLTRAFRLVLDHAVRYRGHGSSVRLQIAPHDHPMGAVHLMLDATPPGFARRTWYHLIDDHADPEVFESPGLLRLRTASSIVRLSGGSLAVDGADGAVCVRIQLREAPADDTPRVTALD